MIVRHILPIGLIVACQSTTASPLPSGPRPLLGEDEIQHHEVALMTRLRANHTRACVRPVLHGPARPGAAETDLLALETPVGALATCLAELDKLSQAEGNLVQSVVARRADDEGEVELCRR